MASFRDKLKAALSIGNANSFSHPYAQSKPQPKPRPKINAQQLSQAMRQGPSFNSFQNLKAPAPRPQPRPINPPGALDRFVGSKINAIRGVIPDLPHSPIVNVLKIGAADITHNRIARQNASNQLRQSLTRAGQTLTDPLTLAQIGGGHGSGRLGRVPENVPRPIKIKAPKVGKNVNKPNVPEVPKPLNKSPINRPPGAEPARLKMEAAFEKVNQQAATGKVNAKDFNEANKLAEEYWKIRDGSVTQPTQGAKIPQKAILRATKSQPQALRSQISPELQKPPISGVDRESEGALLSSRQLKKSLTRPVQKPARNQVAPREDSSSPNNTPRQRGFTISVKNSDEVSPDVRKQASGNYTPRSTAQIALNADKYASGNLKTVTQETHNIIAKKTGTLTDQEIANSIAVAKRLDASKDHEQATQIYNRLAEHGTRGGQQIQAFSLLRNRTPEGVRYQAIKMLKKAGVKLTDQDEKQLGSLVDSLRKTRPNTDARDIALHNVVDFVDRRIPTSFASKAVNFWRASLLTSPVTTGGNILGNATEAATRNLWTNPSAAAIDKFFSLFTGKRTKTLAGGQLAGGKVGVKKGATYMKTGFDARRQPNLKLDAPRRVNFKNKVLDGYVNGVYRWMGAQDQPFYYAAYRQAARDLATADARNLGLRGKAASDYIKKSETDPNWKPQTFTSKSTPETAGRYAVYQNDTLLGHMAGGLKQYAEQHSDLGGAIANFLLPFSQVPSSVAMRIVDRTPIGIAKEIAGQIKNKSFDQRAMSEAVANGTFALPVVVAGAALAKSGLITGAYPTDPKEQQLWKSEGKQPYSVKVGNRWYSLNYMQPFGTILAIGGQFQTDLQNGQSPADAWNKVGATALNSIESQSFLQGINGILSAVNDPNRSASQYITSTASSTVPNFIRTFARATDPNQRVTKGAIQGVQGSIPVLRERLPVKQDMFGKPLPGYDNAANQLLNPLRPSIVRNANDPLIKELQRLQDNQNGIIPTQFNKNSISGHKLTDQQVRDLNASVNSRVQDAWGSIIADPRYKALTDEDKSTVLKRAKDDIADAYKRQFMVDNNFPLTKAATATDQDILAGRLPDYLATPLATTEHTYTVPGGEVDSKKVSDAYNLNTTKLTTARLSGDVTGYIKTAQSQLQNISNQLHDPKITSQKAQRLANQAQKLQSDINKYSYYGGFSKPAKAVSYKGIGSIQGARPDYVSKITKGAAKYGVDINAALAVAAAEGLGGGVGDNGSSFGPFQLHVGGALPAGKGQAWAESQAGIDYALQQIAKVAAGKSGPEAIAAIVGQFERPADPRGEFQRALAIYNGSPATLASGTPKAVTIKVKQGKVVAQPGHNKNGTLKLGKMPSTGLRLSRSRTKTPKFKSVATKPKLKLGRKPKKIKIRSA